MSVTVSDIMKLPSLIEAEVIAGFEGIQKVVSSISVLEYSDPAILDDSLFKNSEFYGSEIVITGFINIKDDVEAQYNTIKRLSDVGEVGIILYYVGIFIPKIDEKIIDLCNKRGFVLICMPKNKINLRYSDVISDVMDAIVHDQMTETYFVAEILQRISLLLDHQRNIDTILKMISDRTRSSFILFDKNYKIIDIVTWPRNFNLEDKENIDALNIIKKIKKTYYIEIKNKKVCSYLDIVRSENAQKMYLITLKENSSLLEDISSQTCSVLQVFDNIWCKNEHNAGTSELIKSIINDEPIRLRRLAKFLNINVAGINKMLIIRNSKGIERQMENDKVSSIILEKSLEILKNYFRTVFGGLYKNDVIIFLGEEIENSLLKENIEEILYNEIFSLKYKIWILTCWNLKGTKEVRNIYFLMVNFAKTMRTIYPKKQFLLKLK